MPARPHRPIKSKRPASSGATNRASDTTAKTRKPAALKRATIRKAATGTRGQSSNAVSAKAANSLERMFEDFDRRLDDITRRTDALMARSREA